MKLLITTLAKPSSCGCLLTTLVHVLRIWHVDFTTLSFELWPSNRANSRYMVLCGCNTATRSEDGKTICSSVMVHFVPVLYDTWGSWPLDLLTTTISWSTLATENLHTKLELSTSCISGCTSLQARFTRFMQWSFAWVCT